MDDCIDDTEVKVKTLGPFMGVDALRGLLNARTSTQNLGNAKGADKIVSDNKGKYGAAVAARTRWAIEAAAFSAMYTDDCRPVLASGFRPPGSLCLCRYPLVDSFHLINTNNPGKGQLGGALFHLGYKRIAGIRS